MKTILIHGRSDDLIVICGGIGEGLYANYGEPTTIQFDNGDRFTVEYTTGGEWVVEVVELNDNMSKAEVLDVGSIETLCAYSQIAVYRPWDGPETVEKVDNE